MLEFTSTKRRPCKAPKCCLHIQIYTWWLAWGHWLNHNILRCSQKRIQASESSLKSKPHSINDALGVALKFVNQPHWLLEHTGSLGVHKTVLIGESHRLPPSQIPDPFLKKCIVW